MLKHFASTQNLPAGTRSNKTLNEETKMSLSVNTEYLTVPVQYLHETVT